MLQQTPMCLLPFSRYTRRDVAYPVSPELCTGESVKPVASSIALPTFYVLTRVTTKIWLIKERVLTTEQTDLCNTDPFKILTHTICSYLGGCYSMYPVI